MIAPSRTERALAVVAPRAALRRYQARAALTSLGMAFGPGGYEGASGRKRSLRDWWPFARSADEDTVGDLEALRSRSRDLERNDAIGGGAIGTTVTSVVGTGIRPQAQIDREILQLDEEAAEKWELRAELVFRIASRQLDITRKKSFPQMQDLVLRSQLSSGDHFVLRRFLERPGDLLGLKLQLVEADRVSTPHGRESDETIVDGVERDADGAPLRYWVANRHPRSLRGSALEWKAIPAFSTSGERMTLHLMHEKREGQARGIPFLAPVIELLKQLSRFSEAELAAAVISSYLTVFTKTTDASGLANLQAPQDDGQTGPGSRKHDLKLAPAAILDLMPNEDVVVMNPMRPNSLFDPFWLAIVRQIGIALGIPYEVLIKHFTASYSAARAALLEGWRFFKVRRSWLATDFNQPVYEWVISEAVARGLLDAPGFFDDPVIRSAWLGAIWIGDAPGQIQPKDETEAYKMLIDLGASTYATATAELTGGDWERNYPRLVRETRLRREGGLDKEAIAERIATEQVALPGAKDVPEKEDPA